VSDVFNNHHYSKTPEETIAAVLAAGTDVDCTNFIGQHGQSAYDKKVITEADMDARLKMLFRVRMRLSHFDPVGPLDMIPPSAVCTDAAKAIARDGAAQGATLLKNAGGTLPLKAGSLSSIAVIGPNANLSKSIAGYYGGNSCDNDFSNLVDAITEMLPGHLVTTALGVPNVKSADTSNIPAAAQMAKAADAVVLALGTDLSWAREGQDAVNITFSDGQLALVSAVANASTKPIVVVTFTAVPLDVTPLLTNKKVGAVLHVGQPSVQTRGVADVIFGAKVPAGRTIQTIYPAAYQNQVSIFDFNMRPGASAYARPDCTKSDPSLCPRGTNPGRTYRFYTGTAVVPFGFGLSYTTFTYAARSLDAAAAAVSLAPLSALLDATRARTGTHFPKLADVPRAGAGYAVKVTNTGTVDADDAVLGFLSPPGAGTDGVPLKVLFGFERVHVKAGQSVTVYLYPALTDFAFANAAGERLPLPGTYKLSFGVQAAGMGYAETTLEATL
jgi:hypothetical protein